MEITTLPEDLVRRDCMLVANDALMSQDRSYTEQDVINAMLPLIEMIENGCAGICQGCMKAMKE